MFQAIIDFYATVHQKVKIFLSFHSATQALLYPWGTDIGPTPNAADLVSTLKITFYGFESKKIIFLGALNF